MDTTSHIIHAHLAASSRHARCDDCDILSNLSPVILYGANDFFSDTMVDAAGYTSGHVVGTRVPGTVKDVKRNSTNTSARHVALLHVLGRQLQLASPGSV